MIGVFAEAFELDLNLPIDNNLREFIVMQEETADDASAGGGFNLALIVGDWVRGVVMLVNFISGGYIIGLFALMPGITFPPVFIVGTQALFAVSAVYGLMYMISGRGSRQSD